MDIVQEIKKDGVLSAVWNSSNVMSAFRSWSSSIKSLCGSGTDKLLQALHPSILSECNSLRKYSLWLLVLLITTALLLWLMKKMVKDPDGKEATVIYSSSATPLAESEDGSEESSRHGSRVRIPVRDNNAFRIRQTYAAMKMGKVLPTQQNASSTKKM